MAPPEAWSSPSATSTSVPGLGLFAIPWERYAAEHDVSAIDPGDLAHHWFDMWPTVEAAMGALRKQERTPESVADLVGD